MPHFAAVRQRKRNAAFISARRPPAATSKCAYPLAHCSLIHSLHKYNWLSGSGFCIHGFNQPPGGNEPCTCPEQAYISSHSLTMEYGNDPQGEDTVLGNISHLETQEIDRRVGVGSVHLPRHFLSGDLSVHRCGTQGRSGDTPRAHRVRAAAMALGHLGQPSPVSSHRGWLMTAPANERLTRSVSGGTGHSTAAGMWRGRLCRQDSPSEAGTEN